MTATDILPTIAPAESDLWPKNRYPDGEYFGSLSLSEYETEFFTGEYGRGLDYYLARLDRLQFSGKRVLDAGCGVGQWSLALSRRFNQVDAIDINEARLETFRQVVSHIGSKNINIQTGSISKIPIPNETYDAIFCYGVIMFTDIQASLAEFRRVLKPGGRVYICQNGDGWYQMLLDTRTDNETKRYMRHILAKSYLERNGIALPGKELCDLASAAKKELQQITTRFGKSYWKYYAKLPFAEQILCKKLQSQPHLNEFLQSYIIRSGPVGYKHVAAYLLQELPNTSRQYFDDLFGRCIRIFQLYPHIIPGDKNAKLQAYLTDIDNDRLSDPTRAYHPEEFGKLLDETGFCHYQYATEAGLIFDTNTLCTGPIYDGHYKTQFCVWETVFSKPTVQPDLMTPEDHIAEARAVQTQRFFISQAMPCHVSIASEDTYPKALMEDAIKRAKRVGGKKHLAFLVESLCQGVVDDEQRFKAIMHFIQRAIVRMPISQPLIQGLLPDDPTVTLMTHIGRCGHVANLAVAMLTLAGISAELWQLPRHVSAKALVNGRWVLAEADIYKNGLFPMNGQGNLVSIDDIQETPYLLDRVQPTGWFAQPGTLLTQDYWGEETHGYVDALPFHKRGFISGYFSAEAIGYPPSLPEITDFSVSGNTFSLTWLSSETPEDDLLGYRVSVGTRSRQWSYNVPGTQDEILTQTSHDVLYLETVKMQVSGIIPDGTSVLYASITAISRRLEKEPDTFFWPSEEAVCQVI